MLNAKRFFDSYLTGANAQLVVEIGSRVVTGSVEHSIRSLFPQSSLCVGLDFEPGTGVDKVMSDPYALPIDNDSADVVISSSCFERAEYFWLSFLEMCRISKDEALIYLNAPSNGRFHRYPVDCWRFYPDSGIALQNWGRRNGYMVTLLESYTSHQDDDFWNDFVAVFAIGPQAAAKHPRRIISAFKDYTNGVTVEEASLLNGTSMTEDQARRVFAHHIAGGRRRLNWLGDVEGGTDLSGLSSSTRDALELQD